MNAGRWEQLKEAFWKAAQDGGGEACVPEAWDVDPASRDQLRLLLDEHRRLAQAGAAAPAEPAAAGVLPPPVNARLNSKSPSVRPPLLVTPEMNVKLLEFNVSELWRNSKSM